MGYVPAYGGNGNSRKVSCSKPGLHCRKRPWEGALYKWLKAPLTLCIWRYINELHQNYVLSRSNFSAPQNFSIFFAIFEAKIIFLFECFECLFEYSSVITSDFEASDVHCFVFRRSDVSLCFYGLFIPAVVVTMVIHLSATASFLIFHSFIRSFIYLYIFFFK